jgi:xanthine dehydrogenase YagS FAD-binding subunit
MVHRFKHLKAKSVADAVRRLAAPGARVHAGGTDLLGCLRDEVFTADTIVSLSGLKELRVSPAAGGLRIGALSTNAEVSASAVINERYKGLAQAAAAVASPQLRNQGTIGGNICQKPRCWYYRGEFACARKGGDTCFAVSGENQYHAILGGEGCYYVHPSDTAPALAALGARVRIASVGGTRLVPIAAFYLPPGKSVTRETVLERNEIVTEILLPPADPGLRSSYRKVRARGAWDFACRRRPGPVSMAARSSGRASPGVAPMPAVEAASNDRRQAADAGHRRGRRRCGVKRTAAEEERLQDRFREGVGTEVTAGAGVSVCTTRLPSCCRLRSWPRDCMGACRGSVSSSSPTRPRPSATPAAPAPELLDVLLVDMPRKSNGRSRRRWRTS